MLQLQAQARLVDNSAAGAGADVVEDDLLSADDHAEGAPDDNRAPVANEEIAQDDFQRDLDERARRRVPDYANLDLEEDVRQFFKTCDDPGTLAHKRRVEDGLRGALQDPFAEPRQGPFPQHPEQRKITKTYSSKGKSRRLSSDSDSELSEEVRRQVRRQLKAQRPITPERKNVDDLFDLFKQLSPGSKKEAVGRLATKDQAAADSDSDASYGNPYTKKKPSVTAPSSSASSSKHKLSPLHMSTHKKKKVAPALSRYDSEPSVLRGRPFQPKAKSSASIDLPALVVVNKLRSSLYVPLWHFTQEGVADGRAREAHVLQTTNPTLTQLLETSGNHAPLGQHKKQDRAMTYREMSAAFNTFIKTMEKVVHEASGEEKEWLEIEKDAWAEMWAMIRDHEFIAKPNGWSILALYVDFLRHDYYDAPYGNRLDPSCWQKDIMAKIRAQFEFGGILSASSSSAAQSAATGINIIGQASSSSSRS
ncbi:unnamed protein product [Tilletia caries]|nr:unnamed protein product [Tilletia caries]